LLYRKRIIIENVLIGVKRVHGYLIIRVLQPVCAMVYR